MTSSPVVLITGGSSGIGLATALRLQQEGYRVAAAARRLAAMDGLARAGVTVLPLDITDDTSRRELVEQVQARLGPIDVLINNAGYGRVGALETMPLAEARGLYEVNVFGLMALTQLVLPAMRERRHGRIVNISSIGGKVVTPFFGWYQSSKFALEALSDGLRLELSPFGVKVVVIEPGLIATGFLDVARPSLEAASCSGPYAGVLGHLLPALERDYASASPPDVVARTISRALKTDRPRTRYGCGHLAHSVLLTRRLLPDWLWDLILLKARS